MPNRASPVLCPGVSGVIGSVALLLLISSCVVTHSLGAAEAQPHLLLHLETGPHLHGTWARPLQAADSQSWTWSALGWWTGAADGQEDSGRAEGGCKVEEGQGFRGGCDRSGWTLVTGLPGQGQ